MRILLRLSLFIALASAATASNAGTIISTIGGASFVSVTSGSIVAVDTVVTFGPTPVGGFAAGIEISFGFDGGVASSGATVTPTGWVDFSGGAYTCGPGLCDNIIAAGEFTGSGTVFTDGSSFALATVLIDTTGLAPGLYAVGAGFTGPGDAIVLDGGTVDLSGEYTTVGATIGIGIPEPGTAALLGFGLVAIAAAARRRG